MKTRFEQFLRAPAHNNTLSSLLLYGSCPSYLDFCAAQICQLYEKSIGSLTLERHTTSRLLDQPHLLLNQGDLFTPAAKLKIIILTDASDKTTNLVKEKLEASAHDVLLILPCQIGAAKKLKTLHETAKQGALVGCYLSSDQEKRYYLSTLVQQDNIPLSPELKRYLFANIEDLSANIADDFRKLALYYQAGDPPITIDQWQQCCLSLMDGQVHDLAMAIADRNPMHIAHYLDAVRQSNIEDMHLLRGILLHFKKLLELKSKMAEGQSAHAAVTSARPMIFFQHQERYRKQLQLWSGENLVAASCQLNEAEKAIKQGQVGAEITVRQIFLGSVANKTVV